MPQITFFMPTFIIESKAKFQIVVSENSVVVFLYKFTNPLKINLNPQGIRVPHVKNGCSRDI
jgi:hypothetical protein